jgi:hypothetical protein
MHISPDTDDGWLVGLKWEDLDSGIEKKLSAWVVTLRKDFFTRQTA